MWKGILYPAVSSDRGIFAEAKNEELIRGNILQILGTRKGERAMLPRFGVRLWEYIHEPLDKVTLQILRLDIIEAIKEWEPRVDVRDIVMSTKPEEGLLRIKIIYALQQSPEDRELDVRVNKNGGISGWAA